MLLPRLALVLIVLGIAACGDEDEPQRPASTPAPTSTPAPAPEDDGGGVAGPPDAGTQRGHGNGGGGGRITVPEPSADPSPPVAVLRLTEAGRVGVATGRDPESGIARTRVSIQGRIRCRDRASGERFERPYQRYAPPPAIQRIKVAPGAELPVSRRRRAPLWTAADCGRPGSTVEAVTGRAWADVTNAHEREASSPATPFGSDPVR